MTRNYYPHGQHPSWYELGRNCTGEEPNPIGRLSQMFVQSAEARLTIKLSRIDDTASIGNIARGVDPIDVVAGPAARHCRRRAECGRSEGRVHPSRAVRRAR